MKHEDNMMKKEDEDWERGREQWGRGGRRKTVRRRRRRTKRRRNEGVRTTQETKTYLSQVTEGQKQRVTLEACDRAGSGKTCGKIQTHPPTSPSPERGKRGGGGRGRKKKTGWKNGNTKRPGRIRYASGQIGRRMTAWGWGVGVGVLESCRWLKDRTSVWESVWM